MIENKQLLRQIKKSKITDFENITKEQFEKFIFMVASSYEETDKNTYRLERALELSSKELRELNDTLEKKVALEVSKNREKDKQLIEQSRFAALGEMIGNIAHQWRQPLSAISTIASGAQLQLELDMLKKDGIIESYAQIIEYVDFLSQTIDDFRNFIKTDKEKVNFNIVDSILKTISLINTSYQDNNIKLYNSINNKEQFISNGIPSELVQVIMNILNNAKDAILNCDIEERRVHIRVESNSDYNIIYIQDNAGGVPKDIIDKIFDPYFTTKHKAQGTGIGLYMSKDIIENHMDGTLKVENITTTLDNESYNGASFKISLPKVVSL